MVRYRYFAGYEKNSDTKVIFEFEIAEDGKTQAYVIEYGVKHRLSPLRRFNYTFEGFDTFEEAFEYAKKGYLIIPIWLN